MIFMGFFLICGFFCVIIIFWNVVELFDVGMKIIKIFIVGYNENYCVVNVLFFYDSKYKEEYVLIGVIFVFIVVEFILLMWLVLLCFINDC